MCRSTKSKERLQKKRENLITPLSKTCNACRETKPAKEYWRSIVGRGGLCNLCKICFKKKRQEFTQKKKDIPKFFTCSHCKKVKNTENNFHKKQDSTTGYNTICKECVNAYGRDWKFQRKMTNEILEELG